MEQVTPRALVKALRPRDPVEPDCARQWPRALREAADAEEVQRVERDPPVRRQLPAGHAHHPGPSSREDGLAPCARRAAIASREDAQAAEGRARRAESLDRNR